MRSLFGKILAWFLVTIIVSIAAFSMTSSLLLLRHGPSGFFPPTIAMQLDDARTAYEEGGPDQLARYLKRLRSYYRNDHYVTDANGRDLVTGQDRSALIVPQRRPSWWSLPSKEPHILAHRSRDGRYVMIGMLRPKRRFWDFWPFYLWIGLVITVLCYILAVHLASPLQSLRRTVDRFGRGDLAARAGSSRKDEIGDLSRAFDRMAERIETLLNAERRLLQDVSHELRSPLARLRFAVALAQDGPDRETALAQIRKDVDRLTGLVDEVLQLTRAEGDPTSRRNDVVALGDMLAQLAEECALEADARQCRVEWRGEDGSSVRGDRELLRRAVENVLRNAIRHAPEGTAIELGLEPREHSATITVRDRGPGVPEALLEDIFKPFFRVEDDRGRASGGAGLGLSIARRIIALHGGTLGARNAGPGLLVTIELPEVIPELGPEPTAGRPLELRVG